MQDAIALTWETLNARVRNYRFGAFASLAFAFGIIIAILWFRTGWLLAGLPGLFLIGFLFVYRDQKLVSDWERVILSYWEKPDFFMGIFAQAMANNPNPLNQSLKSMIRLLPPDPENQRPAEDRLAVYRLVSGTRMALQSIRLYRAGVRGIFLATLPLLAWAAFRFGGEYAYGLVAGVPLWRAMDTLIPRFVWIVWNGKCPTGMAGGRLHEGTGGVGQGGAGDSLVSLDWNGIPDRWKERFLGIGPGRTHDSPKEKTGR